MGKEKRQATLKETQAAQCLMHPETFESAYLLGFLWADGYTSKTTGYKVGCEIVTRDFVDIEKIISNVGIEWKLRHRERLNRQPQTSFRVSNKPLKEHLDKLGFSRKSSHSCEEILESIPKDLQYAWWHGFLDGDGNLYFNKRWSTCQITFAGSYDLSWEYRRKKLIDVVCLERPRINRQVVEKTGHRCSCLRVTNIKDCQKLIRYIYQDENQGIKRKYNKAMEILRLNIAPRKSRIVEI